MARRRETGRAGGGWKGRALAATAVASTMAVIILGGLGKNVPGAPGAEALAAGPGPGPAVGVVFPIRVEGPETIQHLGTGLPPILSARLAASGQWKGLTPADLGMGRAAASAPPAEAELPNWLALAAKKGAGHALTGTLTQRGGSYSLDIVAWDTRTRAQAFTRSVQGASLEELLGKLDVLAKAILEGISVAAVGGAEAAALPPGPTPAWEQVAAAPTPEPVAPGASPAAGPLPFPTPGPTPTSPAAVPEPAAPAPGSVWRSSELDFEAVDIGVGDVDGDQRPEIVLAERSAVHVYRVRDGDLVELRKTKSRLLEDFYGIDLYDMDGDGVQEIAVSAMLHGRFRSFLLSGRGGEGARLVEDIPYFLRSLRLPARPGEALAGQSMGSTGKIYGPIFLLALEGGKWREVAPLDLRAELCLSSLYYGDMDGDGRNEVVDVNLDGHLVVYREGKLLWTSKDLYGGFDNFFDRRAVTPEAGEEDVRIHIYNRILPAGKLAGFPAERLIVTENLSPYGNFLPNVTVGKRNELRALAWNGSILGPAANPFAYSPDEHGSAVLANAVIADYDGDGEEELVVAVVTSSGIPFAGSDTVVYAFKRKK